MGHKNEDSRFAPDANKIISKPINDHKKLAALDSAQRALGGLPHDHWEKRRFRPAPKGPSAAEVWAALKFNLRSSRKQLRFTGKGGRPFWYVPTGDFQRALHEIDSDA